MSNKFTHLEIEGAKGAPEPREIEAIEVLLGVRLPQDFLDFLEIANGGYLDYCIRVPPDDELSFCQLYRAGKDRNGGYGWGTLIGEIEVERRSKNLPREVLPFARDGGDSVVYLDLTPEGRGRVVAFLHCLPDWAGNRPNDGYVVLAPDFMSYTKSIYKCEDLI